MGHPPNQRTCHERCHQAHPCAKVATRKGRDRAIEGRPRKGQRPVRGVRQGTVRRQEESAGRRYLYGAERACADRGRDLLSAGQSGSQGPPAGAGSHGRTCQSQRTDRTD